MSGHVKRIFVSGYRQRIVLVVRFQRFVLVKTEIQRCISSVAVAALFLRWHRATDTKHCFMPAVYWSPHLARSHYCQQLTLSVCPDVPLSVTLLQIASFFVYQWNPAILVVSSPCGTLQNDVLRFLARDSMLSALYTIARPSVCLSVRLSVCPSHGWISRKRLNVS